LISARPHYVIFEAFLSEVVVVRQHLDDCSRRIVLMDTQSTRL